MGRRNRTLITAVLVVLVLVVIGAAALGH